MLRKICCILLTLVVINTSFADSAIKTPMGKIEFVTSMAENAQAEFITGVLFLHNFDYEKARVAFQKAEELDPESVPNWGEAMTYNHPLWDEVDLRKGREALKKIGDTEEDQLKKASNAKEKGYIKAMQVLYGDGEKPMRDLNYLKEMHKLHKQFPDDNEIASFYSLALLGSTEGQRDFTTFMKAGAVAGEVVRVNPEHPGAIHYAVHSFDDPIHAPLGLFYANKYAKIAPDAAHALHMPSHIYLALGMWEDVIKSNQRAWQAGLDNNPSKDAKKYTVHDFHALQWLSYGYLQKLNFKEALKYVKVMEGITTKNPSAMAKWYYAMMRAAYISESKDWQVDLKSFDMTGVELNGSANNIYIDSMIKLNDADNSPKLAQVIKDLEQLCKAIPTKKTIHCGAADYFTSVTDGGIIVGKIIVLELKAQVALKKNESATAINLLKQAVKLEEDTPFGYGPPSPVKPSQELLADVYLKYENYLHAYKYYEMSLKRNPGRTLSEVGLEESLKMIKKKKLKMPLKYHGR